MSSFIDRSTVAPLLRRKERCGSWDAWLLTHVGDTATPLLPNFAPLRWKRLPRLFY